jgi:hypothetical protein
MIIKGDVPISYVARWAKEGEVEEDKAIAPNTVDSVFIREPLDGILLVQPAGMPSQCCCKESIEWCNDIWCCSSTAPALTSVVLVLVPTEDRNPAQKMANNAM